MEVKLLLSENIMCGMSGPYGAHQASAATWPRRSSMKLCRPSPRASAASRKAVTEEEGMPAASGSVRGKESIPLYQQNASRYIPIYEPAHTQWYRDS
ncbi:hypothetical protein LJK88_18395 [Paenibacillus sp. P26]|nr:hypothetical protein LJK88_18395 [Paenibacillus sp. P26]